MKTIEIQIPEGKKAEWVNGVLTLVDEEVKDTRSITERIKTFNDACRELGDEHPFVMQYRLIEASYRGEENISDFIAYLKLRIIVAALNEGWVPQFTESEYRYFPWFCFYTGKEIDDMSDEDKELVFKLPNTTDYGGVACAYANNDSSDTDSSVGSRLAFISRELAEYAGKQFIDIWSDFIRGSK